MSFSDKGEPIFSNDLVEQLDMPDLLDLVKQKQAELPSRWNEFSDRSQRQAIASLLKGGITPAGFASLKPDWLKSVQKIREETEQESKEIEMFEAISKGREN